MDPVVTWCGIVLLAVAAPYAAADWLRQYRAGQRGLAACARADLAFTAGFGSAFLLIATALR